MPQSSESLRLDALRSYEVMDGPPIPELDRLTALAASVCRTPIALVTLIDDKRQWFLARYGLTETETTRSQAICACALAHDELLEVPDTTVDLRFKDFDSVTGSMGVRFYAGMPLFTPEHQALGTLCVIDRRPRRLSAEERGALRTLRDFVMANLELRRRTLQLAAAERRAREIVENTLGLICTHGLDGTLRSINPAAAAALGVAPEDAVGKPLTDFMRHEDAPHIIGYLERLKDIGRDEGLLPVLHRNGMRRIWRYKSVVSNVRGDEPLVVGHALDVTDDPR